MDIQSESTYENESGSTSNRTLTLKRPVFNQKEFDNEYLIRNQESNRESKINLFSLFDPRRFIRLFTILNLITEYNFKNDFIPDLIAGFTVGVVV